jgi:hypothetical protein
MGLAPSVWALGCQLSGSAWVEAWIESIKVAITHPISAILKHPFSYTTLL